MRVVSIDEDAYFSHRALHEGAAVTIWTSLRYVLARRQPPRLYALGVEWLRSWSSRGDGLVHGPFSPAEDDSARLADAGLTVSGTWPLTLC